MTKSIEMKLNDELLKAVRGLDQRVVDFGVCEGLAVAVNGYTPNGFLIRAESVEVAESGLHYLKGEFFEIHLVPETKIYCVNLENSTRSNEGLEVHCWLDESVHLKRCRFHGDWNYKLIPKSKS